MLYINIIIYIYFFFFLTHTHARMCMHTKYMKYNIHLLLQDMQLSWWSARIFFVSNHFDHRSDFPLIIVLCALLRVECHSCLAKHIQRAGNARRDDYRLSYWGVILHRPTNFFTSAHWHVTIRTIDLDGIIARELTRERDISPQSLWTKGRRFAGT
jgi:hypothetical protein